ncbi:hypothetical protein [Martelella sp. AD-3]|uniref:hypothetical protein n=1 Tax=Martelella sp. AD-3 TaxID=686597 RepID=UPI000462EC11|nr:hypothetical protein [Martelella sp. AD-3]AMM84050.1 hypothetical protein AZF01_06500 [Martelella sp. AD-3]
MWDFSVTKSLVIMGRTAPFIIFRVIVYFVIAVFFVAVTGTGAGLGYAVAGFGDAGQRATGALWGGGIGFALTAGVIFFMREYLLYVVKAGHIAVMVEALDGRSLPRGQSQIAYARTIVADHFGQTSVLFGIDQLVKGVLRVVTGLLEGILTLVPIPGLNNIAGLIRGYLKIAVGLLDEVILAHAFRHRSDNPWASAREALVLYGQNAKPMMINAAWVTLFVYGLSFIAFLLMLAPAAAVVYLIPGAWSAGGFIFAILFAWAIKAALIEPFAIACLLQAFFKVTDGQQPNPAWEAKLDGASEKFRKMGQQATAWMGGHTGTGAKV